MNYGSNFAIISFENVILKTNVTTFFAISKNLYLYTAKEIFMHIFSFSSASIKLMQYGFFVVICHATGILLLARLSAYVYSFIFFPMIEHSIVSLIAILFGVLGLEYIDKISR